MPTEAGYSNTKKQGQTAHKTLHTLGSSIVGAHVVPKSLVERQTIPLAIVSVALSSDTKSIRIEATGHTALVGDVARFYTGSIQGAELEIIAVLDANSFVIRNVVGIPAIADTLKVMYYVTPKADQEGNVNFSPGPTTFIQDSITVTVTEDVADTLNKGLPILPMYYRNGVQVTVNDDTVTPAKNRPFPVKIVGYTGDINITAGDLNVSTVATNDSMAIGDSATGTTANIRNNAVTTLNELHVSDDDAIALLTTIDADTSVLVTPIGAAGSAHIAPGVQVLGSDGTNNVRLKTDVAGELQIDVLSSALPTGASTLAEQQTQTTALSAIQTAVQLIDNSANVDGTPIGTAGLAIGGRDGSGNFQQVGVNTAGEILVNFGTAGFATETTLSALNNKVANGYGAATGAVRSAAQVGNAGGAADFNSGADSAQTLRVSANLKRAGNELSYGAGTSDANTQRVNVASDSNLAKESQLTSLLTNTATRTINSVVNFTASNASITAPASAKGFIIQNAVISAGNIRWNLAGAASASAGFYLGVGQSTSYIDGAANLSIFDVDGGGIDACIVWFT